MPSRRFAVFVAIFFVSFLIQIGSALAGVILAVIGAGVASVASYLLMRRVWKQPSVVPILLAGASSLAGALSVLGSSREPTLSLLFAPLAAVATSSMCWWLDGRAANIRTCALCRRPSQLLFQCPRCRQTICDNLDCWDFQHPRCQRCAETGVLLLPDDQNWWRGTFAAAPVGAQCRSCLCQTADLLFACPRCGAVQCRDCWDDKNSQCPACLWHWPHLPDTARQYLLTKER